MSYFLSFWLLGITSKKTRSRSRRSTGMLRGKRYFTKKRGYREELFTYFLASLRITILNRCKFAVKNPPILDRAVYALFSFTQDIYLEQVQIWCKKLLSVPPFFCKIPLSAKHAGVTDACHICLFCSFPRTTTNVARGSQVNLNIIILIYISISWNPSIINDK